MKPQLAPPSISNDCSTLEVARLLGLAVRSVQMMVDRGELEAWKTSGGHRRISRSSVERWLSSRQGLPSSAAAQPGDAGPRKGSRGGSRAPMVLLIEDSSHYQNLISLLMLRQFPEVDLRVANNGITGLVMFGQLQPDVLIVDILLPGIDGATLITSLRSQAQFASRLIVVTSLDADQRASFGFALEGIPVIHKPRLVAELPALLAQSLQAKPAKRAADLARS